MEVAHVPTKIPLTILILHRHDLIERRATATQCWKLRPPPCVGSSFVGFYVGSYSGGKLP